MKKFLCVLLVLAFVVCLVPGCEDKPADKVGSALNDLGDAAEDAADDAADAAEDVAEESGL